MKYQKLYHNPIEIIQSHCPDADISHITFDPKMGRNDGEYCRIEECGHDGTMLFTVQMFEKLMLPLLNKTTCYKPTLPDDCEKIRDIKYTIGPICHAIAYGRVKLRCNKHHKYPGLVERIRCPVKCEYIF